MKKATLFLLGSIIVLFFSCKNDGSKNSSFITERIQYDVPIKSPDAELDWWVQNIEGSKRESLINMIINNVYDGKVQAYDFLNKPLTPDEVKKIGNRHDTLFMPSMEPPYEDSTVIINEKLKINDITKLRFLEEWRINEKTMEIEKKVLGMALMLANYDPNGDLRGYKQMFWIYFDKRYPIK